MYCTPVEKERKLVWCGKVGFLGLDGWREGGLVG